MFGRRKQKKAAAATGSGNESSNLRAPGKVVSGGEDGHHSRHVSAATIGATPIANHHASLPPVSPLQSGTFDFSNPFRDLPSPAASFVSSIRPKGSVENFSRPRTSDGAVGAIGDHSRAKSSVNLAPPVLPPIPRVASATQKNEAAISREPSWIAETEGQINESDIPATANTEILERARDEVDNTSAVSRQSSRKSTKSLKHQLSFEPVKELPPFAFQRTDTAGTGVASLGIPDDNNDEPVMSASVFPSVTNAQPLTTPKNMASNIYIPGPAMNRAFIDSRDRAYPTMSIRPTAMLSSSNSTPNLLSPSSPVPRSAASPSSISKTPLSASSSTFTTASQGSPQSTATSSNIQLQKTPTNYSGSTAKISHNHSQSSSTTKSSSRKRTESTIGTPYSETSPSFPAPKFVSTRPRTSGGQNKVGGVDVPTHHTTSKGSPGPPPTEKAKDPPKKERRKTMLMNPMNLLTRRRTEEPRPQLTPEEKATQEAALRKQKKVAAIGVEKTSDNFDPSIRGKGVHDFSAPRAERRNTSYSFLGQDDSVNGSRPTTLQSTGSVPLMTGVKPGADQRHSVLSDDTQGSKKNRRSDHAPIFLEHLTESTPTGLLEAESRENKDFLQRVSGISSLSQESGVLPPFARRSQVLDPHQASLWNDAESSKRSSDPSTVGRERDSSFSGVSSMSPVTGRTSVANTDVLLRESMNSSLLISPQSERFPKSPAKSPSLSSGGRPASDVSSLRSPRPTSIGVALQPSVEPIAEDSSPLSASPPLPSPSNAPHLRTPSEQAPEFNAGLAHFRNNSINAPEAVQNTSTEAGVASPHLVPSSAAQSSLPSPVASYFSGRSNDSTPEPMTVDSAIQMRLPGGPAQLVENRASMQPLKVVEKRQSAVGHSSSKSLAPKHAKSNASRFSFQLGEDKSVEEERMLEEKHRRIMTNARNKQSPQAQAGSSRIDPDDEEDDFDIEDAMDDMDEMELQEAAEQRQIGLLQGFLGSPSQMQTGHVPPAERDRVVEDDASIYDDEHIPEVLDESQLGYFDHPAFRAHSALASHTRDGSYATLATLPSVMGGSTGSMRSGFSGWRGDVVDKFIDSYTNHNSSPSWGGGTIDEERPVSRGSPLAQVVQSNELTASSGLSKEVAHEEPTKEENEPAHPVSPLIQEETHEEKKNQFYLQPKATGGSGWSSTWSVDKPPTSRGPSSASRVSAVSVVSDKESKAPSSLHSSVKGDRARTIGSQSTKSRQSFASGVTDGDGIYSSRAARKSRLKDKRRQTAGSEMAPADTFSISGDWAGFHFGSEPDLALGSQTDKMDSDVPPIPKLPDSIARTDHARMSDGIALPLYSNADTETTNVHLDELPPPPSGPPPPVPEQSRMTPDSETMPSKAANRYTASTYDTQSPMSKRGTWSDIGHAIAEPGTETITEEKAVRASTPAKPCSEFQNPGFDADDDDLYFDDGAFAKEDLNPGLSARATSLDEEALDNETYWQQRRSELSMAASQLNEAPRFGHQRDTSGLTFTSMGSDGPYPSFAIPNVSKAKERNSRMLLEDLPLQGPIDPRLIPQRNPSEDAKRLGLSSRVPPLPAPAGGSLISDKRMQIYQAALVDAVIKADAAGRFLRAPSVKTERSLSLYPTEDGDEDRSVYSQQVGGDGASSYSRDEEGILQPQNGLESDDPARKPSNAETTTTEGQDSLFNRGVNYSPPKPGFDFGFDASTHQSETPIDDIYSYDFAGSDYLFDHDDGIDDDDLVAAANAEALALDDGTYGQEFDFYAKARPSSGDAQAINGGYFGEDGDNGLARNKSIKEPNLTPITERSEFSTRNSFIGSMHGQFGPASTGFGGAVAPASPALARLPISPLSEHETSLESLRKLRLSAFGGGSSASGGGSPTTSIATGGYFGNAVMANVNSNVGLHGSSPMAYSSSERSSGSFHPQQNQQHGHDRNSPLRTSFYSNINNSENSPVSASSITHQQQIPYDLDATPKKTPLPPRNSMISNGAGGIGSAGHSRTGSDSVSYVKEHDPTGNGPPRWVLERRRTSEQGLETLVDREVLGSGWI